MATWSGFEAAAPDLAAVGARLLTQFGPGLGFLATVRADGGPRLHPICPVLADGELWAFIIGTSPKCTDLRRDGRFALHSFPPAEVDDEFVVTGRAVEVDDEPGSDRWTALCAATTADVGVAGEVLFRLDVETAMASIYEGRGIYPPARLTWRG